MQKPLMFVSYAVLAALLFVCLLYFLGLMQLNGVKWIALACTAVWFATTPLWMGRELRIDAAEVEI